MPGIDFSRCVFNSSDHEGVTPYYPHVLFVDTSEGSVSHAMVTGSNRGQDFRLFTQNYMITKKLTFDILFKSTRKIFPNYVLGKKTVSDI